MRDSDWQRSDNQIPLRVIAGRYRGRKLKSPASMRIRPTSDRLRETLFNVVAARVPGSRFLDLCAGTGAVGIEALSRGATQVTFVEQSRKACNLIQANLDLCSVGKDQSRIIQIPAAEFLRDMTRQDLGQWDLIFFDPPYTSDYLSVLELLGAHTPLFFAEDGLLIVEHDSKNPLKDLIGGIERRRVLKQGDSALSFYKVN